MNRLKLGTKLILFLLLAFSKAYASNNGASEPNAQLADHIHSLRVGLEQNQSAPGLADSLFKQVTFLKELNELYEHEMTRLSQHIETMKQSLAERDLQIKNMGTELAEARRKLSSLEEKFGIGKKSSDESTIHILDLGSDFDIRELNDNESVLSLVEQYFSNNIVFSDEAKRGVAKLNFQSTDILMQALIGLASDMHTIVFIEKAPDIGKAFKLKRNLDIGTEGKMTRKDAKIVRERTVKVDGQEYVGWLHVKYGSREPNMLRVYFDFDHAHKKIIVTHIASHLRTAGTHRM